MFGRNYRTGNDNRVDGITLKQLEKFNFARRVATSVSKQHLVPLTLEGVSNSRRKAADRFRVDLRHDNADELSGTGAQRAGLVRAHVTGLLDRLLNTLGLIGRNISTIEIARDRGARNARQLGDIFHLYHEYPRP